MRLEMPAKHVASTSALSLLLARKASCEHGRHNKLIESCSLWFLKNILATININSSFRFLFNLAYDFSIILLEQVIQIIPS